jgi:hypothetical protein
VHEKKFSGYGITSELWFNEWILNMKKLLLGLLALGSIAANAQDEVRVTTSAFAQNTQTTLMDELIAQRTYELIPSLSTETGHLSLYPCPKHLEIEATSWGMNFNYSDDVDAGHLPINKEFAQVNLEKVNQDEIVENSYSNETDSRVKYLKSSIVTGTQITGKRHLTYRNGNKLMRAGYVPGRVFHNNLVEIEATKTTTGFKLLKRETDFLDSKESSERVCAYKPR